MIYIAPKYDKNKSAYFLPICSFGWRRGSVVRASVFDWQTFPDLCMIYV